tara:strand:- start:452 stop:958 length:507 start_codon:yes stop_codon:yes gene_type:complete
MADEKEESEEKGPNIILVVIGTALITLLLGGGALFAMGVFDSTESSSEGTEETAEKSESMNKPKAPQVEIETIFDDSVSLKGGAKLVFKLVAEIPEDQKSKDALVRSLPKIQHELIMHMSDYQKGDLEGRSRKEDVLELVLGIINKKYKTKESNFVINALYFTKFDVQ